MNKKRYIILAIISLVATFSGWKIVSTLVHGDDYLRAIPMEANAVMCIRAGSLAKSTTGLNPVVAGLLTRLLSLQTGIKTSQPFYAFLVPGGNPGVVCAVRSRSTLIHFLQDRHLEVQKVGHYSYVSYDALKIIFDDEKLIMLQAKSHAKDADLKSRLEAFMQQTDSVNILLNRLDALNAPMTLAARGDALPRILERKFENFLPSGGELSQLIVTAQFTPRDKGMDVEGTLHTDHKAFDEMLSRMDSTFRPMNGVVLPDSVSDSFWCDVRMDADGKQLLSLLRSMPKVRLSLLSLNMCVDADLMISAIRGPMRIRSGRMGQNGKGTILMARLQSSSFLDKAASWDDSLANGGIVYERLDTTRFFLHALEQDFWFGTEADCLYLSTHEAASSTPEQSWSALSPGECDVRMSGNVQLRRFFPSLVCVIPNNYLRSVVHRMVSPWRTLSFQVGDSRHFRIRIE